MNVTRPRWTRLVSRAPASCIGGSPGPPVRAPGWSVWQDTSARWPGSGGVSPSQRCPSAPPARRSPGRTTETVPPSSRRSNWESRRSRPAAMRPATVRVGLVSPRSTCESIGAETPERSARSRSERSIPSRSARTREPNGVATSIRTYVIAYRLGPASGLGRVRSSPPPSLKAMAEPLTQRPDVLVLGVGGTLGEAWMRGLLDGAGATAGIDFRECEYFVGTSAGSIVAAFLAAGRPPDSGAEARAARDWAAAAEEDGRRGPVSTALGRVGRAVATPLAPLALASATPAGAVARATALRAVPRTRRSMPGLGRLVDETGARFDGRLRIAAVDRRSGRRVIFGAPGAPRARVSQAVLASCSIPGMFAPVRIDDREYVDGGVWSPTTLDATPVGRGTQVLCLNPTASLAASRSAFGALRAFSQSAAMAETLTLRARGAEVRTIAPDARAADVMGANLMDRRRVGEVLSAGYAQGRALAT